MADTRIKQSIRVLEFLREGPATRLDLWTCCGVANATSVITKLRQRGYDIETIMLEDTNQFGEKVRYAKWVLHDKEDK